VPKAAAEQADKANEQAFALKLERGPSHGRPRVAVRCDCDAEDRPARLLQRARIPRGYQHCDFENFDLEIYDQEPQAAKWNHSLKQARLVVEAFAREFGPATEHGILLMGPCGVGKTHLAAAALRAIVLRGFGGLFYDYRELLKQIQASYDPVSQTSELAVLEPVLTAELLLLDDLGASKPSEWARETLGHILNTRYNERRPTIVTTNYLDREMRDGKPAVLPSGESAARAEESLADRVGQRIRSRLYEMCRTVEIVAPDYRREIRQAGRFRA
jgi:DNA replication protein DnaC